VLICCVDHGINAPSTQVARMVASCGSPLQAAIAAGQCAGRPPRRSGEALARVAIRAASCLQFNAEEAAGEVIASFRKEGGGVPGFGHRVHNPDPRAVACWRWPMNGA
jgi:citrate synthase